MCRHDSDDAKIRKRKNENETWADHKKTCLNYGRGPGLVARRTKKIDSPGWVYGYTPMKLRASVLVSAAPADANSCVRTIQTVTDTWPNVAVVPIWRITRLRWEPHDTRFRMRFNDTDDLQSAEERAGFARLKLQLIPRFCEKRLERKFDWWRSSWSFCQNIHEMGIESSVGLWGIRSPSDKSMICEH